ncbi:MULTISPECIES: AAC(3) family N-acetyltransferase [Actinomadura]|uniref:Aminoglycoside N(3)-acetyltransferase n=1 Tax=Actinomadura yumaensis TaxID=111807 RepID=A0ABW2CBV3_9ACTN|nr:AAC(3) family N-acetyltransferase [Actinomadura sp. J1-007]MWK38046.1 aminoglycoside N(3)-acetyltransferase [Actinomadura sp. J1-007]
MTVTTERLAEAIDRLDLAGRAVMAHTSLRSFGERVEGGPDAILDALLDQGCTVLVPSFSEPQFGVAPPPGLRPSRNALDYASPFAIPDAPPAVYTVDCGVVNAGMGALPARLVAREGARRGHHPLNSFAALGPDASALVGAQAPDDVYAPIRALVERDGAILQIGVGLDRMTALHYAEQLSGRRLFVRWALRPDGEVCAVEVGSCSEGFPRLAPYLRARTATVAASRWNAYEARATVDAAVAALTADQTITRCADPNCLRCEDSIAGGPIGPVALG